MPVKKALCSEKVRISFPQDDVIDLLLYMDA